MSKVIVNPAVCSRSYMRKKRGGKLPIDRLMLFSKFTILKVKR